MNYFSNFKKINYSLDSKNKEFKTVTDLFSRIRFIKDVLTNSQVYYEYQLKDSDTPEIIAQKLYNDVNKYWMIYFINEKIDPYYDFLTEYTSFNNYIIGKYGSIETAKNQFSHYEKRTVTIVDDNGFITTDVQLSGLTSKTYNQTTKSIQTVILPTMSNPSIFISNTVSIVDGVKITIEVYHDYVNAYDNEEREFEKNRSIKLLKSEFTSTVENQFKSLLTTE